MSKANSASGQLAFLRALIARPGHVGAIAPSGRALGRAMARQADPAKAGDVLELGPGTGSITAALIERGFAPGRIVAIEFDPELAARLRARCPGVQTLVGDAFALDATLGPAAPFAAIVSSLPLLNWPLEARAGLIGDALARLAPGAPFIQFSYGLTPPVSASAKFAVRRAAVVWANLPPARVWVYEPR